MTIHSGTRVRATRKPVVVLAGEDRNDRRSLRILLEEFCPGMRGRIVEINDPVRLRDASSEALADRVRVLAQKARARAARERAELACTFVHEDLDMADGERYLAARERVQKALGARLGTAHYVLCVEEVEAWLLLFPDALNGLVSSWVVPKQYRNRDTASISDPKGVLLRAVSSDGRRYRESDAPDIFARAVALGILDRPDGTNRSWSQLKSDAAECCRLHIPLQRRPQ